MYAAMIALSLAMFEIHFLFLGENFFSVIWLNTGRGKCSYFSPVRQTVSVSIICCYYFAYNGRGHQFQNQPFCFTCGTDLLILWSFQM